MKLIFTFWEVLKILLLVSPIRNNDFYVLFDFELVKICSTLIKCYIRIIIIIILGRMPLSTSLLLQLTSIGDIFYQEFRAKDVTWSLVQGVTDSVLVKIWERCVRNGSLRQRWSKKKLIRRGLFTKQMYLRHTKVQREIAVSGYQSVDMSQCKVAFQEDEHAYKVILSISLLIRLNVKPQKCKYTWHTLFQSSILLHPVSRAYCVSPLWVVYLCTVMN